MDTEYIADQLKDLLAFRENQLTETQEMSGLSEEYNGRYLSANARISACIEELREDAGYKTKLQYLAADFDNYRKRTAGTEKRAYDEACGRVIAEILNTYDELEYLVKELDKKMTPAMMVSSTTEDPLQVGVHVIFSNLAKTLNGLGCEKIECAYGDKFDVSTMEAISVREIQDNEDCAPDDVVDIYRSGWKLNGKVIRPAKVVVGKEREQQVAD